MDVEDPFGRWLFGGTFIPKGWLMTVYWKDFAASMKFGYRRFPIISIWGAQTSQVWCLTNMSHTKFQCLFFVPNPLWHSSNKWYQLTSTFSGCQNISKFTSILMLRPWRCCNLSCIGFFLTWERFLLLTFLLVIYLLMFDAFWVSWIFEPQLCGWFSGFLRCRFLFQDPRHG